MPTHVAEKKAPTSTDALQASIDALAKRVEQIAVALSIPKTK